MAYTAPVVTSVGLTIPSYADILDYLTTNFRSIYGQTVNLDNSSSDFQFISIVSLALRDAAQALQLDYNNRAPNFAIGAALDSLVKLNGIARKPATFSTCAVTLTGVPGTVVSNGVVRDTNGVQWSLPATVTLDVSGTVTVTATCQKVGAVNALVAQIVFIVTPTAGWTSVTNSVAATVGLPVETDSQLRTRQAISTELPSITILSGTVAALAAVPDVTRYNVLENATGAPDAFGNPAHSITSVVEGGTDINVATAIYNNRGIGPFTNGGITINITDPVTGIVTPIGFSRPVYRDIFVTLTVHSLNASFTSATVDAVRSAILTYLNALQIGEDLIISALYAVAMGVIADVRNPSFSVTQVLAGVGSPSGSTDIVINFNQVTRGAIGNIVVNVV